MKSSGKAYEQAVEITPFGLAPIKPQGSPVTYDSEIQGSVTTYQHIAYALGYIVTYEELQDNLYKEVGTRRAEGNAFSMSQTTETVAAFLYNNAFSTTYYTTGDGAAIISASHTSPLGGTFSNALTPAADLEEASLEDITIQIMLAENDAGNKINIMPTSLHVSPYEWYIPGSSAPTARTA